MKIKITIEPKDLLVQANIVKFLKEAENRGWDFKYKVETIKEKKR